jgi:hypothetical protein
MRARIRFATDDRKKSVGKAAHSPLERSKTLSRPFGWGDVGPYEDGGLVHLDGDRPLALTRWLAVFVDYDAGVEEHLPGVGQQGIYWLWLVVRKRKGAACELAELSDVEVSITELRKVRSYSLTGVF